MLVTGATIRTRVVFTLRVLPLRSLGAVGLLVVVPTAVTSFRGGTDFVVPLTLGVLMGGAGLGYAFDDPASATLAASPTPLLVRRLWRLAMAVAIVGLAWGVAFVVASVSAPLALHGMGRTWGYEVVSVAGLAVAINAAGQRRLGVGSLGFAGLVGSLLVVFTVSVTAARLPWLPSVAFPEAADRWLWVAIPAWLVAGWNSRDLACQTIDWRRIRTLGDIA